MIAAFIATSILLSVGVVILGNATNTCTSLADYRTPSFVSAVTVTNQGVNYTSAPTVSFSGGGGSGATATATITGDAVTAVTVTGSGSAYTSAPTVSFSGGGGVNAAATSTISSTQTGWAGQCQTNQTQTNSAYQLLGVVLIVIAAVVILTVIKYL